MKVSVDRKTVYLIVFTLAWLSIGAGIFHNGWYETWNALHIPTLSPPFADMRTVQGAVLSDQKGLNPQLNNPGDPWDRAMNYPKIWLWIAELLHFDRETNFLLFVSAYVLAYLVSCFILLRKFPSLYLLLAMFSWPSLLAVERGNNDLLAFVLLFAGISLSQSYLRASLVLLAAILKVYPAFLVITLAKKQKILIYLILIITVYFLFSLNELKIIQAGNTALTDPASLTASYGLNTTVRNIQQLVQGLPSTTDSLVKYTLIFVSLAAAALISRVKSLGLADRSVYKTELFISGGIVFSGTYLLTSNWDYRLIFLFFCIPYILSIQNSFFKHSLLIGILLSVNFGFLWENLPQSGTMIGAAIKYCVFLMVTACLVKEITEDAPVIFLKPLKQFYETTLDRMHSKYKLWYLQPRGWLLIIILSWGLVNFTGFFYKGFVRQYTPHYGTLKLRITGLRPPGNIMINLKTDNTQNFSRSSYRSFNSTELTYEVGNLYYGNYVIQVIHDQNNNETADLDSETGLFREGFGMVNMDKLNLRNAAAVKTGSTYENLKYAFDVNEDGKTVDIKIVYPPFPWENK